jgi:hypothetical protein
MRAGADRIDYAGGPKLMGWSFTVEEGEGIRFRLDGKGCRLAYLGNAEYDKAHDEADSTRKCCGTPRTGGHRGTCENSVMRCGELRP